MRMEASGYFRIISTKGTLEFSLSNMECSAFNGDDYRDLIDFNYPEIFECILKNIKWDTEALPMGIDLGSYAIPNNRDEFYQSKLWVDLGFKVDDDFSLFQTYKNVQIEYYMTYGQKAGTIIDFENEKVVHDGEAIVYNALDTYVFDWASSYKLDDNNEICQIYGSEILDELMTIYRKSDAEEIDNNIKAYLSNLYHNIDDSETSLDLDTKISDDEISTIIGIMKQ